MGEDVAIAGVEPVAIPCPEPQKKTRDECGVEWRLLFVLLGSDTNGEDTVEEPAMQSRKLIDALRYTGVLACIARAIASASGSTINARLVGSSDRSDMSMDSSTGNKRTSVWLPAVNNGTALRVPIGLRLVNRAPRPTISPSDIPTAVLPLDMLSRLNRIHVRTPEHWHCTSTST